MFATKDECARTIRQLGKLEAEGTSRIRGRERRKRSYTVIHTKRWMHVTVKIDVMHFMCKVRCRDERGIRENNGIPSGAFIIRVENQFVLECTLDVLMRVDICKELASA